jgi:hypothetical protein
MVRDLLTDETDAHGTCTLGKYRPTQPCEYEYSYLGGDPGKKDANETKRNENENETAIPLEAVAGTAFYGQLGLTSSIQPSIEHHT